MLILSHSWGFGRVNGVTGKKGFRRLKETL